MTSEKLSEIILKTPEDTELWAECFAKLLAPGDFIALFGELGAGKSHFSRAVIRFLSQDQGLIIPSPTFTLVQSYPTKICEIFHLDLWRLNSADEVLELGFDEMSTGIMLIEWADRLKDNLPEGVIKLYFSRSLEVSEERPVSTLTLQGEKDNSKFKKACMDFNQRLVCSLESGKS